MNKKKLTKGGKIRQIGGQCMCSVYSHCTLYSVQGVSEIYVFVQETTEPPEPNGEHKQGGRNPSQLQWGGGGGGGG